MKSSVNHPVYGPITYEEGAWSGKKIITVGGRELKKIDKNTFVFSEGESPMMATLKGSWLVGASLCVGGEEIRLVSKPAWYEWILAFLPFVLVVVWGNSVPLCSIIPVAGGAIGGALGGVSFVVSMSLFRGKSVGGKLLTALLAMLVTFGIGVLLALLFLSMML